MAYNLDAASITTLQTLGLLDGQFKQVADGVAEDRYALWLGSGISFERVDGLKQVISRVLEFLRGQIDFGGNSCRFQNALDETLDLAGLTPEELAQIDFHTEFAFWSNSDAIITRLHNKYAQLLDVQVSGEDSDYLLWHGIDIASTFANPDIEPDVEHLCLAVLIEEGAVSEIATANWDGLIERAAKELSPEQSQITVCVKPEDLRAPKSRARLYKFHGCAESAVKDEAGYRRFLIGRQSQIHGWASKPENALIVNSLVSVLASKPTLMVGLSAQDANIQALFAFAANQIMPWPWPGDRPSYIFSENRIGRDQRGILENVYGDSYTTQTRDEIEASSLIRAYAKPLLIALVLHVLCSKLRRLSDLAPSQLSVPDKEELHSGIIILRNQIASAEDGDRLSLVRNIIRISSNVIGLFRDGELGPEPRGYNPVTSTPIHQLATERGLSASGLKEAAVALGLLGIGVREGLWELQAKAAENDSERAIQISSDNAHLKLLFVANSQVALNLEVGDEQICASKTVVIYSSEIAPRFTRSPHSTPGRTGKRARREVSIKRLLGDSDNFQELMQNFRTELAL